jgi:alkanesulfonate monooxygenase SsuD/methylene tetrahydromethanopterin reductase-like flavin-dependent oxidoreductase (luciferase family)
MKFGLYYNFEITGEKWPKAYACSLEEVAAAERNGFDIVMVAEHHFQRFGITCSPLVVAAAHAAVTKKIKVGPGVVLLPLHHPIRVAEDATMVDNISGGRVVLGLGMGWNKEEAAGLGIPWAQRKSRMEEGLDIIDRLLKNDRVSYSGNHYSFQNIRLMPKPVQKPIPIWMAAIEEPAVRRAGRLGHIWMQPPVLPLKVLKERIRAYSEELKKATGKEYSELEHPIRRDGYVDMDSNRAIEYTKEGEDEHYKYYLEEGLQLLDEEGNTLKLSDLESLWNLLKGRYIMGNPDEVIGQVERYSKETGATTVILKLHGMDPDKYHDRMMKAIELIGKKVIPYFEKSKR